MERLHQLVGQPLDQSDGIHQDDPLSVWQGEFPGGGIQRCEQLILNIDLRRGQKIQKRGFPHVGVAHDSGGDGSVFAAALPDTGTVFA